MVWIDEIVKSGLCVCCESEKKERKTQGREQKRTRNNCKQTVMNESAIDSTEKVCGRENTRDTRDNSARLYLWGAQERTASQ